ncbi:hypothetical protein ATO6_15495 [Oceanicola sp. 22II-s10i]|uniref:DUF4326 domain-containing protein n=1 Tax=Oceanicola sp. 22II-s10i TaxID=1317116 RepID=UPI000B5217E0|nr:DUF4326 domain-containing protein [Oceanicola sp. 22II-s10i]OWU83832.1 hypothetical protein ATO6_15495 [Oceanicola sp. 22II-s10i]
MTRPRRIQLSRRKGWRKPEGAVVVARPTAFGNPFTVAAARDAGWGGTDADLQRQCVEAFRQWLNGSEADWQGPESDAARVELLRRLRELRGHDLACWCAPGAPCHADVLIEMANRS